MKVYVGNIAFSLEDNDVKEIFAEFGKVESADVIYDHLTGRSRGFAFVKMASEEDGENAIAGLNGFKVRGRELVVREAKPTRATDRPRYDPNDRGGYFNSYGAIWRP